MEGKILFRFGKKEDLEKIQNGKIRYKSAEYYNEFQKKTGNTSIGDEHDSKDCTEDAIGFMFNQETGEAIEKVLIDIVEEDEEVLKCPIFCCTVIKEEDIKKLLKEENCKMFFKEFFDKDYWSHCLIINIDKYLQQFKNTCEREDIIYDNDIVKYYNPAKTPIEKELEIEKDKFRISFWKKEAQYKGQHEYRFLLKNRRIENTKDEYNQYIGDISNISKMINTNELKIKTINEILNYVNVKY